MEPSQLHTLTRVESSAILKWLRKDPSVRLSQVPEFKDGAYDEI